METKQLPKKKEEQKGSFPTGLMVTLIVAGIGAARYNKFLNFIASVRFRIVVIQKDQ